MKYHHFFAAMLFSVTTTVIAEQGAVAVTNLSTEAGPNPQIAMITGTATNTSDRNLGQVVIHFNLYDQHNMLVGNTLANAYNLGTGEKWKFKAPTTVPYDHFKIVRIDAI